MEKIIIATAARGGGKTAFADILKKVTEEAEKEINELKAEINRLEVDNMLLRNGASLSRNRIKMLEDANSSIKEKGFERIKRITDLEKENKTLRIELQELAQSKLDEAVVELVEAEATIDKLEKEKAYFEDLYEKRLKLYNEVVEDYNKLKNKQLQEDYCRGDVETSKVIKYMAIESENKELYNKLNNLSERYLRLKAGYDELMQNKLDAANAEIAKLEHKIERKDKYIEKIRHENDLLESKCRLRESDLKCLEKMYFELGDDRDVMHKALEIAVKHINAVNYSPFDTRPAITIEDYILKAKEEIKNE